MKRPNNVTMHPWSPSSNWATEAKYQKSILQMQQIYNFTHARRPRVGGKMGCYEACIVWFDVHCSPHPGATSANAAGEFAGGPFRPDRHFPFSRSKRQRGPSVARGLTEGRD